MAGSLLITGGKQRGDAVWHKEFRHYEKAMLARLDLATGKVTSVYEHVTPPHLCAEGSPSIVFKSATLTADRLYLSTETEVLILGWPDLKLIYHLTHPSFNDVHHVTPHGEDLYVVSTGLDMVVRFDRNYQAVEFLPVLDEAPWSRFSPQTDWRRVASTKPHKAHPNFLFFLDDEPWVTRCECRDAVKLRDFNQRIHVGVERVHDGNVRQDQVEFTTVDGHVVYADARTHQVTRVVPLAPMVRSDSMLGWCRGLHQEGALTYVGFSRLRPTRLFQNLRWLKHQITEREAPREFLPTRVSAFDLQAGRLVRDYSLEEAEMAAVFSIIGV